MRRRYDRRRAGNAAKAAAAAVDAKASSADASAGGDTATAPARRLSSQMKLHVHGPEFQNGDELVLNPEFFPELKELAHDKYVVEIFHATDSERLREESAVAKATPFSDTEYARAHRRLLLEVPPSSATPPKGKWQVSVFKDTASAFQLAPFNDATLRFIEKKRVQLDFVEISLKDQFLSRRDLWFLKQSLVGMALFVGKNVRVQGTRWQVMELRARGETVRSGVVSSTTKFAFRSRTSRVMWLVQMSPEMWEMANSGKLYLEIFLQVVQNVLNKWIKHNVSHSLTIILFARSYYPELDARERDVGYGALTTPPRSLHNKGARSAVGRVLYHSGSSRRPRVDTATDSAFPFVGKTDDMFAIGVDEDGRHYQDFYKIVAFDSAVTDMQPLLVQLKQEMNEFPHLCGWRLPRSMPPPLSTGLPGDRERLPGRFPERRRGVPSHARDGNLLEAVNLVLNIFEKHHIDRHLARSGQSVVIITAGNGIFRVKQRLAEITEQRMMDHGIGIDMVSLSTPPLHKCPLFLFKESDMSELKLPTNVDGMESIEGGGHDVCTCGTVQPQPPAGARASTQARPSRTGSGDLAANGDAAPQPTEFSLRGGQLHHSQSQQNQPPPSSQGLCRHCLARLAERKPYEVPLWIPLSFVQERMMADHKCPLDVDITNSCSICCPFGVKRQSPAFEPLPMSRMFNDIATWQNPPRSSRPSHASLPKPLERLLNHFQEPVADAAKNDFGHDDDDDDMSFFHMRTFSSDFSLLLDDDYLSLGRDSELVRARAPSLTSLDDDEFSMNPNGSVELPKIRSYAADDMQRYRREFESYDEAVFAAPSPKKPTKSRPKSFMGGDIDHQSVDLRLTQTPPLRPQAPLSSKKSAGRFAASSAFHHSGSAGGDDGQPQRQAGEPNRWRSPQNTGLITSSPGPPTRSSVHSDGKIRHTKGDNGNGDRSSGADAEDTSSPDLSVARARTLGGSLPKSFQLLTDKDGATYGNSPILMPQGESNAKEHLFHSHAYVYKQLTSNQRRWSQVRSSDSKNPYRLVQSVLKWKSLCCPALLPLTTDYIPEAGDLRKHYTESFYSVVLPERDETSGVTFRDYREFVMEMVAQRFSQDFQLVTMETEKTAATPGSVIFRLSMGHRIHEIKYNEEAQTVDVKRFLQRAKARSDVDIMEYRYSLWSPVADSFLFATQEFRKYPRHEYQWNYLDHLICGYYDDMNDALRYKRILFCIIPPQIKGDAQQDEATLKAYTDRCRKFIDYLKSKAGDAAMFPAIKFASDWRSGMNRSGAAAFKHVSRENVKVVLHATDSPNSQNWLVTRLDTELSATQSFHIEVQWVVCRSALVEDFTQGLIRRAKQLGLDFMQVPENGVSNDLDLHPLICPIFMPLRDPSEQRIVEATLVDQLNFFCEALHVIPPTHLNHEDEYTIIDTVQPANTRRRIRFYRQYVHRSLACFVRVTQTGLVWISNRKLQCRDIQPVYDAIRDKVEAVRAASAALKGMLSGVVEVAEAAVAARHTKQQSDKEGKKEEGVGEDAKTVDQPESAAEQQPASDAHPSAPAEAASPTGGPIERASDDSSSSTSEKENVVAAANAEPASGTGRAGAKPVAAGAAAGDQH